MKTQILLFITCLFAGLLPAQPLQRENAIPFTEQGDTLSSPFAGGLNQSQFSQIDLNEDGLPDLMVFDRSGDKTTTYLLSIESNLKYIHAPQYQNSFPVLSNWALLRDYNCDGKPDIFTAIKGGSGIRVFTNTSTSGGLEFQLASSDLMVDGSPVYVNAGDLPAITDVDGDGDMDILTFDSGGFFVQYLENTGGCGSLDYSLATPCWGGFQEDPFTNDIYLNIGCKGGGPSESGGLHAGSTLATLDIEADSARELLLGDINFSNLVFLHNGGTANFSTIDTFISHYPNNQIPVNIFLFPAAFPLDVNQDSLQDLIVAPNAPNISANFDAVWYYQNTGTAAQASFERQQVDFLQDEMVDCGSDAHPVFFDYNADGLPDLVIGNLRYKNAAANEQTALTLYENTGTAQSPAFQLASRDYLNLSSLFNPAILGAAPAFGDLDGDGDEDLIIGDLEGQLHYFRNDAGAGNPASFVLTGPQFKGLDVGQNAMPQIVDLNRDGKLDLLVGEKAGNLNFFENMGTAQAPDFLMPPDNTLGSVDVTPQCCGGLSAPFAYQNTSGAFEILMGTESGGIFRIDSIDGNLSGAFVVRSDSFGEIAEGTHTSISGADIDQDGLMEWVVGNLRGGISIYEDNPQSPMGLADWQHSRFDIQVVPNPGQQSLLRVSLPAHLELSIHVYDISGRELFVQDFTASPHFETPLPPMLPGLYFIHVIAEGRHAAVTSWRVP